jgi:hypothetical protein
VSLSGVPHRVRLPVDDALRLCAVSLQNKTGPPPGFCKHCPNVPYRISRLWGVTVAGLTMQDYGELSIKQTAVLYVQSFRRDLG